MVPLKRQESVLKKQGTLGPLYQFRDELELVLKLARLEWKMAAMSAWAHAWMRQVEQAARHVAIEQHQPLLAALETRNQPE